MGSSVSTTVSAHNLAVATSCRFAVQKEARGSRELVEHTRQKLGVDFHQTTADGEITLEPVYCLGNCATGPSVRIGDQILGRVDPATMDRLLDALTRVPLRFQSQPMAPETSDTKRGAQ